MNPPHFSTAPYAVLWDLDGTLADTMVYHFRSWRDIFATEGRELTWHTFAASFGQRNDTALNSMLGIELSAAEVERISNRKEAGFRSLLRAEGLQFLPGVECWLAAGVARGWRQALVTSAPRPNVETMLEVLHLSDFFQVVVTGDDVTLGKPNPQPFLRAADLLAVPPARCLVIEDSPAGIEAARRAGMRSIAVGPAHAALPASLAVSSLENLAPDVLDALLGAML